MFIKYLLVFTLTTSSALASVDQFEGFELDTPLKSTLFEKSFEKGKASETVRAYDPINKVAYDHVIVGEYQSETNPLRDFDKWRYVTVFNKEEVNERIAYLPYFEESCHDNSVFMAQWDESRSIKVTIQTSIGFEQLGLSASVGISLEEGVTFSASRRIRAVEGIEARHYPHKLSETWRGVTYIQTYNSKKKEYGYLLPSKWQSWNDTYPYEFYLDNQNVGFKVVREITKKCGNYNPKTDPISEAERYFNQ